MNFGEMRNRGVEIGLNLVPIKLSSGFKWIYTLRLPRIITKYCR